MSAGDAWRWFVESFDSIETRRRKFRERYIESRPPIPDRPLPILPAVVVPIDQTYPPRPEPELVGVEEYEVVRVTPWDTGLLDEDEHVDVMPILGPEGTVVDEVPVRPQRVRSYVEEVDPDA